MKLLGRPGNWIVVIGIYFTTLSPQGKNRRKQYFEHGIQIRWCDVFGFSSKIQQWRASLWALRLQRGRRRVDSLDSRRQYFFPFRNRIFELVCETLFMILPLFNDMEPVELGQIYVLIFLACLKRNAPVNGADVLLLEGHAIRVVFGLFKSDADNELLHRMAIVEKENLDFNSQFLNGKFWQ